MPGLLLILLVLFFVSGILLSLRFAIVLLRPSSTQPEIKKGRP